MVRSIGRLEPPVPQPALVQQLVELREELLQAKKTGEGTHVKLMGVTQHLMALPDPAADTVDTVESLGASSGLSSEIVVPPPIPEDYAPTLLLRTIDDSPEFAKDPLSNTKSFASIDTNEMTDTAVMSVTSHAALQTLPDLPLSELQAKYGDKFGDKFDDKFGDKAGNKSADSAVNPFDQTIPGDPAALPLVNTDVVPPLMASTQAAPAQTSAPGFAPPLSSDFFAMAAAASLGAATVGAVSATSKSTAEVPVEAIEPAVEPLVEQAADDGVPVLAAVENSVEDSFEDMVEPDPAFETIETLEPLEEVQPIEVKVEPLAEVAPIEVRAPLTPPDSEIAFTQVNVPAEPVPASTDFGLTSGICNSAGSECTNKRTSECTSECTNKRTSKRPRC
jgi:hypothetical protein